MAAVWKLSPMARKISPSCFLSLLWVAVVLAALCWEARGEHLSPEHSKKLQLRRLKEAATENSPLPIHRVPVNQCAFRKELSNAFVNIWSRYHYNESDTIGVPSYRTSGLFVHALDEDLGEDKNTQCAPVLKPNGKTWSLDHCIYNLIHKHTNQRPEYPADWRGYEDYFPTFNTSDEAVCVNYLSLDSPAFAGKRNPPWCPGANGQKIGGAAFSYLRADLSKEANKIVEAWAESPEKIWAGPIYSTFTKSNVGFILDGAKMPYPENLRRTGDQSVQGDGLGERGAAQPSQIEPRMSVMCAFAGDAETVNRRACRCGKIHDDEPDYPTCYRDSDLDRYEQEMRAGACQVTFKQNASAENWSFDYAATWTSRQQQCSVVVDISEVGNGSLQNEFASDENIQNPWDDVFIPAALKVADMGPINQCKPLTSWPQNGCATPWNEISIRCETPSAVPTRTGSWPTHRKLPIAAFYYLADDASVHNKDIPEAERQRYASAMAEAFMRLTGRSDVPVLRISNLGLVGHAEDERDNKSPFQCLHKDQALTDASSSTSEGSHSAIDAAAGATSSAIVVAAVLLHIFNL